MYRKTCFPRTTQSAPQLWNSHHPKLNVCTPPPSLPHPRRSKRLSENTIIRSVLLQKKIHQRPYLLVGLDDLNDLVVDLPPEQLLRLAAVIHRVQEHQLYTQLTQPGRKEVRQDKNKSTRNKHRAKNELRMSRERLLVPQADVLRFEDLPVGRLAGDDDVQLVHGFHHGPKQR